VAAAVVVASQAPIVNWHLLEVNKQKHLLNSEVSSTIFDIQFFHSLILYYLLYLFGFYSVTMKFIRHIQAAHIVLCY
jgi:hypothetical protein